MTTLITLRHCSTCADERPFERPLCEDGHGADCPDWVCLECGAGVYVAWLPQPAVPAARHVAAA